MKGLLVRVAIDSTAGNWNGPIDPDSGHFVYVAIPEDKRSFRKGYNRSYDIVVPSLSRMEVDLPLHLRNNFMHLDPDFKNLTYGDCHPRSLPIKELKHGDFLVFYAGLRSIKKPRILRYAIIGFYLINEVISADSIPEERWDENAHTRRHPIQKDDIIVRAQKGSSGRLKCCIEIGEYRNRAYRVKRELLKEWGGLSASDGYIQRSARLPFFNEPEAFLGWFKSQHPKLMEVNNE